MGRSGKKPISRTKNKIFKKAPSSPPQLLLFSNAFWTKNTLASASVIFFIAFGLYAPTLPYDYILDDKVVISENEFTTSGVQGIWDILSTESFEGYLGSQQNLVAGSRYRPLSIVTFAIEYEFFGLSPPISHIVNGILFGLTCVLLFRLLFLLFPRNQQKEINWFWSIPLLAALLFAVHPIHTEVVANIKGRDEIMAFLGALGALYFSFRYVDSGKWVYLTGVFVAFFLGLMSKENAITFLAVIPLAMYFFTQSSISRIASVFIVSAGAACLYLLIRTAVVGSLFAGSGEIVDLMNNPFVEMNSPQKYATILYTLGKYLQLLIFPFPLSHDYYPYAIAIKEWVDFPVILSFVFHLGLVGMAIVGFRKKWISSFWILYYLATLSIVSNLFFPVGTLMNERFVYFSSLAFCALIPYYAIVKIPNYLKNKKIFRELGLAFCALYIVVFIAISWYRIPIWSNTVDLNASAVVAYPNSARANLFYGIALYHQFREAEPGDQKSRLLNQSAHYIGRALEVYPTYQTALQMQSGVVVERYRSHGDLGRLLHEFKEILKVSPRVEYVREYLEYLNKRPSNRDELIPFYYDLGYKTLFPLGFTTEAYVYLKMGYELDPFHLGINSALAEVLDEVGNPTEAQKYRKRALPLNQGL